MIASAETGLYQQAETILHRVDPRLKVFSCLLLVALSFSASGWIELGPVFLAVLLAAWFVRPFSFRIPRLLWMLRWLLLFTLLLYLFFSSGRTLWGISWLSYDGLLIGTRVCLQVALAVAASALLAMTTSSVELSLAFGWFVRPLGWLGFRTTDWQRMILLALDFVPLVYAEINASSQAVNPSGDHNAGFRRSRFYRFAKELHRLIFRLVDRGDEIAHRMAVNADGRADQQSLSPFLPLALLDQLFIFTLCLATFVFWLAG